jgi:hypothetical protein
MTTDLTKDLFDDKGRPIVVVYGVGTIETAQALTIAADTIAPAVPIGIEANLALTCAGGVADALTTITAPSTFTGKRVILRNATGTPATNTITVTNGAGIILAAAGNFILNHADDCIVLEWKSANVWRELYRVSCG